MLYLYADKVEEHFPKYTVLEGINGAGEFEFDMQAVLNADLHLDGLVLVGRLFDRIIHDELLLLGNAVVISVDDHINVVAKADYYPIIAFKLLLDTVELECVLT